MKHSSQSLAPFAAPFIKNASGRRNTVILSVLLNLGVLTSLVLAVFVAN